MKTSISAILTMLLLANADAAIRRVGHGGYADFGTVQEAISASSVGDTVLVSPNLFPYDGFSVNRTLTIIGAGTDTIPGEASMIQSGINITADADGSHVQGLWIWGSNQPLADSWASTVRIDSGAQNIVIDDCAIQANTSSWYWNDFRMYVCIAIYSDPITVRRCLFMGSSSTAGIYFRDGASNARIENCVFSRFQSGISGGTQLSVDHCVFQNCGMAVNTNGSATVSNSACLCDVIPLAGNPSASYCATAGAVPPGPGNFAIVGGEFVNLVENDPRRSDFHLSPGSPLRDAGDPLSYDDRDGSRADIGVYGGQVPFTPFGIPTYPFVVDLDVTPFSVPQNGILQIQSTGRVGSGN